MAKNETRNITVKKPESAVKGKPASASARKITVTAKEVPAPKAVTKQAPKVVEKQTPVKEAPKAKTEHKTIKFYVLAAFVRPVAGNRLFAHTHAAFMLFNLFAPKSPGVKRATLEAVVGPRAVKYHLEKGTLESAVDRIKLSVFGANFFTARAAEGKLDKNTAEKYLAVMREGKPDSDLGVRGDQIMPVFMEV